jgi:hypothetical protein
MTDHSARPDDSPEPGDRCKDCSLPIVWVGPGRADWMHVSPFRATCVKPSDLLIALWAIGDDDSANALTPDEAMCNAPATHCIQPWGDVSRIDRSLWTVWCAEHVAADDQPYAWTPLSRFTDG